MSRVRHNKLFRWTLRGKAYWSLVGTGLAVLILLMGVM